MVKNSFLFLLLFCFQLSFSQKWTIVFLKDKANPVYSIANPEKFLSQRAILRREKQQISVNELDLPVNQAYVDSFNTKGFKVIGRSKWLNALLVESDTVQINRLNFKFVNNTFPLSRKESVQKKRPKEEENLKNVSINNNSSVYGAAYTQISMLGVDEMHKLGYKGEGLLIAVFDEGFLNVDKLAAFDSLRLQNRILATYSFQANNKDVFGKGQHGTNVLSCLAANIPGTIIGTAPNATYVLLQTEVAEYEFPIEEFFWAEAAEFADSIGVDLINSSLGYTDFDNSSLDHTYADMDGKTTICSRAAQIASQVGIIVCNSAGNEGAKSWKYIKAPADAESIIAVGAVTAEETKSSFSSFGPSADGRIKPDLSAMGTSVALVDAVSGNVVPKNNGTSFASPLLCGLAAGMWQANPTLTNLELISLLKSTASQANSPNNELGYGIPRFQTPTVLTNNFINNLVVVNPVVNQRIEFYLKYSLVEPQQIMITLYDARGKTLIDQKPLIFSEIGTYILDAPFQQGIYVLRLINQNGNREIKVCVY